MTTVTPSMAKGIFVTPRNPPFEFREEDVPEHWLAGDPLASAAWDALSVITASGEKLFMDAGRQLLERIDDPVVAAETRAFLQQEATHSAVHARYNRVLAARGRPVDAIDRFAADVLDAVDRHAGRATMFGMAIAGEQTIGEFGHALLERPGIFAQAAEGPRSLWFWHFYEEVEHQAALYDGWAYVYGDGPGGRSCRALGTAYLATALVLVWPAATYAMLAPASRSRSTFLDPRVLFTQMLGHEGLMRGAVPNVTKLLGPAFHPFDAHDPAPTLARNRHHVDARWERPRPAAGRHGVLPKGPAPEPLRARDLVAFARFTTYAIARTRRFLEEIDA